MVGKPTIRPDSFVASPSWLGSSISGNRSPGLRFSRMEGLHCCLSSLRDHAAAHLFRLLFRLSLFIFFEETLLTEPIAEPIDPGITRQPLLAHAEAVVALGVDVQLGGLAGRFPGGVQA